MDRRTRRYFLGTKNRNSNKKGPLCVRRNSGNQDSNKAKGSPNDDCTYRNGNAPVGYYISRITEVCRKNKNTDIVVEVSYILEPVLQCYNRANKLVAEDAKNTFYYIQQTYTVGSDSYKVLTSAMENVLGLTPGTKILLTDLVGVGEFVKLEYPDDSSMCNISVRYPAFYKDINNSILQIQEENVSVDIMQKDLEKTSSKENISDNVQDNVTEGVKESCTNCESLLFDDDDDDFEFDDFDDDDDLLDVDDDDDLE